MSIPIKAIVCATLTVVAVTSSNVLPAKSASAPSSAAAKSDSSEKQALIKQLLSASRAASDAQLGYNMMVDQELKGLNASIAAHIDEDSKLTAEQRVQAKAMALAKLTKRMDRFKQLTAEKLNMNQLVGDVYMKLYDKYFSLDELKAMLAYYQSPVGQKSLNVLPQLSAEAVKLIDAEAAPRMKAITEQLDQEESDGKL